MANAAGYCRYCQTSDSRYLRTEVGTKGKVWCGAVWYNWGDGIRILTRSRKACAIPFPHDPWQLQASIVVKV